MRLALTGAGGTVGGFVAAAALEAGHAVRSLGRRPPRPGLPPGDLGHVPWQLGSPATLAGCDVLVHAALAHQPGRFRGGEGDDPEGFLRANVEGSLRLFAEAERAGVRRIVLISSRAVFDGWPAGTRLAEDLPARPTDLYGAAKVALEEALAERAAAGGPATSILRATGVYGRPAPGWPQKWDALFASIRAGIPPPPRVATEVHGADLAASVLLSLDGAPPVDVRHVSDLLLDSRDLTRLAARAFRARVALPPRSDGRSVSVLDCSRNLARGWSPGGWRRLTATLREAACEATREEDEGRDG